MAMAGAAGVPVAEVLAAHTAVRAGERSHLLHRFVDGTEWRRVAPRLDDDGKGPVHRQLAECALALQSVSLPAFGELGTVGGGSGGGIETALDRRCELRVADPRRRDWFRSVLASEAAALAAEVPVLCHDDLHHGNVLLTLSAGAWRVSGVLDWDKAWAGPAESDVARMAFWDGMTGPGSWDVYRAAVPADDAWPRRSLVHQLLWCLEYDVATERHRADTAGVARALGLAEDWAT
jgi:aminoglycoside phosphotransferase (APT) family kinase protein